MVSGCGKGGEVEIARSLFEEMLDDQWVFEKRHWSCTKIWRGKEENLMRLP